MRKSSQEMKVRRSSRISSEDSGSKKRKDSGTSQDKRRKASVESVKSNSSMKNESKSEKSKKSVNPTKYIISKKTPTVLNHKVAPVLCEITQNAFVACGNSILVYSLQTGIYIKTMRLKPRDPTLEKGTGDVHRSNIIFL